jgi:hypothetical protein
MYGHHYSFFVTYEWAKYARVLQYARLEILAKDKHFRLLVPFISNQKIKYCASDPLFISNIFLYMSQIGQNVCACEGSPA